nr:uncharacterized protein LOC110363568 isoform X1 [Columba livia]
MNLLRNSLLPFAMSARKENGHDSMEQGQSKASVLQPGTGPTGVASVGLRAVVESGLQPHRGTGNRTGGKEEQGRPAAAICRGSRSSSIFLSPSGCHCGRTTMHTHTSVTGTAAVMPGSAFVPKAGSTERDGDLQILKSMT